MKYSYLYLLPIFIIAISGCTKDFLDAKPNTNIVSPTSLDEYQAMLENVDYLNRATPALLQTSSDDYVFTSYGAWQGTIFNAERNSYIWAKDLYEGQRDVKDWNIGYSSILICNNVLEGLDKLKNTDINKRQANNLKGWALFMRSYLLYDLVRSFSPAYDIQTSSIELGMPIRLKSGIDKVEQRSSVEQTYNQIFSDLSQSVSLLQPGITTTNKERPSKVAAMALYARIYLSMRNYAQAERYADSTLNLYHTLLDYNTLSLTEKAPFGLNNLETILHTTVITNYYNTIQTIEAITAVTINPELYNLYENNDLRKHIYFGTNTSGRLFMKFGYSGSYPMPFTGLATDEIYLIKAECQARRNEVQGALITINTLLGNRYKTGTFTPLTAIDATDALNKILTERRKELIWRSMRWTDLKRLNKEGAAIFLFRELNGTRYTLFPNDPKYVFPIPDEERELSGIRQNER